MVRNDLFDDIKMRLYFIRKEFLYQEGLSDGRIVPFDDEFYEKMSHVYFNCIPISMHIKYLNPSGGRIGKCDDRSLLMFFCFDDALLVRGDIKSLELKYGKEKAWHYWIEMGNYVYDPTLLMRFDKDLYYKIYCPNNLVKSTKEDYQKTDEGYYNMVRSVSVSDFQLGGSRRADLYVSIPLYKSYAEILPNQEFKRELDEYLTLIQYDEKQVYETLMSECEMISQGNYDKLVFTKKDRKIGDFQK